jgi:hypothetical protein
MISERRWDETGEEHFRETFRPPVWGPRGRQCAHLLVLTGLDASTIVRRTKHPVGRSARCVPRILGMLVKVKSTRRFDCLEVTT